jgi:hypothetical protein
MQNALCVAQLFLLFAVIILNTVVIILKAV